MARPVTTLVVFFVAFNLFSVALTASGVASAVGLSASYGQSCPVDNPTQEQINSIPACELQDNTDDVPTGPGTGSTLLGLYNLVGGFASAIYDFIFPGLNLLNYAGVPTFITDRLLGDMISLLIAIDVAAFIRGYEL